MAMTASSPAPVGAGQSEGERSPFVRLTELLSPYSPGKPLITLAVGEAARRIEAEMFRAAFPKARMVLVPAPDGHGGGLLAVDADDLVIGATRSARSSLGLAPDRTFQPMPAADLLSGPGAALEQFGDVERGVLQRARLRAQGNVSAAAKALGVSRATLHRKLKRFGLNGH
jgi:transcriptional regulator of acetoin/glycerol metabolism